MNSATCLRWAVLVTVLVLSACSSEKSDPEMVCNALERSGATSEAPDDTLRAMEWLDQHPKTEKVRTLMRGLAAAPDQRQRSTQLRDEAARVGIPTCPLADHFDSTVKR